jgi:flavin reductase (DIM6/NTAB) family NADH-FMN oxidoreductase RutF
MNATSAQVAEDVDEFTLGGLTPRDSTVVSVPHVAEAAVVFECRVSNVHQLHSADQAAIQTWLTLGEVVGVHIDHALVQEGVYRTAAAQPILRGGGPADYFEVASAQLFSMPGRSRNVG